MTATPPPAGPPTGPLPVASTSKRKRNGAIALGVIGLIGGVMIGRAATNSDDKDATSSRAAITLLDEPATAFSTPVAPEVPAPAPPPAPSGAVMPAVVCFNLQDAQDTIQAAGVFFSRSDDATGQGRSQIIDSNWLVVAQTPEPGTVIGEGDAVLSVVQYGEMNPCGV